MGYCFNPRPPRRAGATADDLVMLNARLVSILARPEGRALLVRGFYPAAQAVFQSSPAPKGGRYWVYGLWAIKSIKVSILARPEGRALRTGWTTCEPAELFQSSPAPKGGRYR